MNVFELFASIEVDEKGYLRSLNSAEQATAQTASSVESQLGRMQRGFEEFGRNATRLGGQITGAVTAPIAGLATLAGAAFATQEQAEVRLRAMLQANGREVDALFDQYTAFASQLQSITVIGDETTIAMLAQAEALGLTGEAAERAITNAAGLSSALGLNAESALRYTALLEEGDTTMLQRYIPALRQVEDQSEKVALAQEFLAKMFSAATAEADSARGQFKQMRNAVGDLLEVFGEVVVGPLLPFVEKLQELAERAQQMDDNTIRLITTIAGIAAVVGPAIVVLGQFAFAVSNLVGAFAALSGAMLPLLGAAGIIAALVGAYVVMDRALGGNREAINQQRLFVQDLMGDYAQYRNDLSVTSASEREAALNRMQTLRAELQDRLNILEAAAAQETARVQGWLDNPFIKFLLPGFVTPEAGANRGTLDAIEEVRESLQLLDSDIEALEGGAQVLHSFTTTPLRDVDSFTTAYGEEVPEAAGAAAEAVEALGQAFNRNAPFINIGNEAAFTIAAIERTEGRITSLSDAFKKFARLGVPMTADALNLLTERFEDVPEAAGATVGALDALGAAFTRTADAWNIADPVAFTIAAIERTEGRITSLSDAFEKFARVGVPMTADALNLLTERFEAESEAASQGEAVDAASLRRRKRAYVEYQESRIAGEALVAQEVAEAAEEAARAEESALRRRKRWYAEYTQSRVAGEQMVRNEQQATNDFIGERSVQLTRRAGRGDGGLSEVATRTQEALSLLGEKAMGVAQQAFPVFTNAIQAFSTGGPLAALGSIFMDLIVQTDGFQRLIEVVNRLLEPLIRALEPLMDAVITVVEALEPLFLIVVKLIEVALAPLVWILENVVAPVFEWLANMLVRVYNALFGWLFGRIEQDTGTPEEPKKGEPGYSEEGQLDDGLYGPEQGFEWQWVYASNSDGAIYVNPGGSIEFAGAVKNPRNEREYNSRLSLLRTALGFAPNAEMRNTILQEIGATEARRDQFLGVEGEDELAPPPDTTMAPPPEVAAPPSFTAPDVVEEMPVWSEQELLGDVDRQFGSAGQAVQLAVATPMIEAANIFRDVANILTGGITGGSIYQAHTEAMREHSLALNRMVTEGFRVTVGGGQAASPTGLPRYI